MKKLLLSVFVLSSLIIAAVFLRNEGASSDGEILLVVKEGQMVQEEYVSFEEGQNLFDLLNKTYNLTCANVNYKPVDDCVNLYGGSPVILGIDDIMTNWTDTYFAIYINGEYSSYGVGSIEFENGDTILFEVKPVGGE